MNTNREFLVMLSNKKGAIFLEVPTGIFQCSLVNLEGRAGRAWPLIGLCVMTESNKKYT